MTRSRTAEDPSACPRRRPARRATARAVLLALAAGAALAAVNASCWPAGPTSLTIRLVNSSGFVLDPNLYASGGAVAAAELFQPANLIRSFAEGTFPTIPAGQTRQVTLACGSAATIGVDRPVFTGVGTGGVSPDSVVWHMGEQFQCGQTVVFTYTATGEEFHVSASVE